LVPANKIHDFHVPIRPSGLYWTATLTPGNLVVAPDGRAATLDVTALAGIDEPTFPKPGPVYQATISYHIAWTATGPQYAIDNAAKHYALLAYPAQARGTFKVSVPALGFTWASDPLETSLSTDALLGSEVNGALYDQGQRPGQGTMPGLPNTGGGGGRRSFAMPGLGGTVAGVAGLAAAALALRQRGVREEDR